MAYEWDGYGNYVPSRYWQEGRRECFEFFIGPGGVSLWCERRVAHLGDCTAQYGGEMYGYNWAEKRSYRRRDRWRVTAE